MVRVLSITTGGGARSRAFACNVIPILGSLLLLWGSTTVTAAPEILTFTLTSVMNQYAIEMQLDTIGPARSVYLLPVLYASEYYSAKNGGPKPLYIPSADLCLHQEEWNKFLAPGQGESVDTITPYEVKWAVSEGAKEVNLSLRKGSGAEGKNITVIGSTNPLRIIF